MRDGFIKAAAAAPLIEVADCIHNSEQILTLIKTMEQNGAGIMVFPELCITGYTCRDLFFQNTLLDSAKERLVWLAHQTETVDGLIVVGLPFETEGKLYNTAAFLNRGKILGIVPKTHLPNSDGYNEARQFAPAPKNVKIVSIGGAEVPFGAKLLFACDEMKPLVLGCEICEDLWVPESPGIRLAKAGATILVNPAAGAEITARAKARRALLKTESSRLLCGYVYASAGEGESTTDGVYAGHSLICEGGEILAESKRFENETIYADIDVKKILSDRRKTTTFPAAGSEGFTVCSFSLELKETPLTRRFDPFPFVPEGEEERNERCGEILMIQAMALKKRLSHAHSETAVLGISGGLDSTLALLVSAKACDLLGRDRSSIIAVTMPCFGTTDRTYNNACELAKSLGTTFMEVDIKDAVSGHFRDIGHDPKIKDVTFENSQARERTQVLMDLANRFNGLVVGTGDLSELALGWATYNGDHMSMYGVNGSVPKTLIRHIVRFYADTCEDKKLSELLLDILDTPVSPELLPPKDGEIAQKTEDLVGPYELHDFFLYYMLRAGYEPAKILRVAQTAFSDKYDRAEILKWLKTFYRRFFTQQFKRSCMPDGPKVGTVSLSPRGDLSMPSDANARIWLKEAEQLEEA